MLWLMHRPFASLCEREKGSRGWSKWCKRLISQKEKQATQFKILESLITKTEIYQRVTITNTSAEIQEMHKNHVIFSDCKSDSRPDTSTHLGPPKYLDHLNWVAQNSLNELNNLGSSCTTSFIHFAKSTQSV